VAITRKVVRLNTMPSVALAGFGEHPQVFRQDVRVGDDGVHDSKPCLRPSVQIRGVEGVRGVTRRRKQKTRARQTVCGLRTLYNASSWMLVPNTVTGTAPLHLQLAPAAL
jgi:hypothetical protein